MAGNTGHPFFGNQYTKSNYHGGYTYDWEPNAVNELTEVATCSVSHTNELSSNERDFSIPHFSRDSVSSEVSTPTKGNDIEITDRLLIVAGIATAITVVVQLSLFAYNFFKEKKANAEILSLKMENIGTCQYCDKPLNDSDYISEKNSKNHKAYVVCQNCGKRNFAWYPEDKLTNN
jgi:hypothetical protein